MVDSVLSVLVLEDDPGRVRLFRRRFPMAAFAETVAEAVALLPSRSRGDLVFLDHDLGGREMVLDTIEMTGMAVVDWLVANPTPVGQVVVHSLNHVRRPEMVRRLRDAGYPADELPFTRLRQQL